MREPGAVVAGGQHFLQTPGPTNVPEQVLRAMGRPTIDHRGGEFRELVSTLLPRLRQVFGTTQPVVIYPSSGTGAWEAALTNVLSPGDRVLAFETGHFATLWQAMASKLGLTVDFVPGDWRHAVDPAVVEELLTEDEAHRIAAVMVVHNETSTGVASPVPDIRAAIDRAGHPALLLVDVISSAASMDYQHDTWGVDVSIGCSQKGLMLPPGLGFNVVSRRALAAAETAGLRRSYWDWTAVIEANEGGLFPYTPSTNLLFGLSEALDMLLAEGLPNVFARHQRYAAATRAAVAAWGLDVLCADPCAYSATTTAVRVPEGVDATGVCRIAVDRFAMSLGIGLGRLSDRVFRIGHLGHLNSLMFCGVLSGVDAALRLAGAPVPTGAIAPVVEEFLTSATG
jgi:alanine-glyoxylate transaminase/serine-glyoxylate transaminase/serine-pyruvate transaminase